MAYFECVIGGGGTSLTIQITTSSTVLYGQTITISKGGSTVGTTAFDNTGNAEYTVRETGTYTVSVTFSGTTFSDTVEVTDTFDATIEATPDGSTVTPVNDIQTWLHCGNLWNKNYTALSEVLADTTTLLALINSNNAVDYMVRSHAWCDDVCADATAMTYISANDYAADTLLADDNPGLVPKMTSNTTPSGVASASDISTTGYEAYKAFNMDTSSYWHSNSTTGVKWLRYEFETAKTIRKAYLYAINYERLGNVIVRGSNDAITWNELTEAKIPSQIECKFDFTKNIGSYKYFEIYMASASAVNVSILQFYEKETCWLESICNSTYFESVLNVKVPTMTSDTTPSGQCYSNPTCSSSYPAYRVFDGNDSTEGSMGTAYKTAMGYYRFTAPVKVQKFDCSSVAETTTYTIKGSDDGTTWNDVAVYSVSNGNKRSFVINAPTSAYAYWGVERYSSTAKGSTFYTIQFYGRAAS